MVGLAEEGTVSLEEVDLEGPLVVVTGSEGDGLSLLTRRSCDQLVRIPLRGATPSLNASVATALLLYEVARRGWMRGLTGTAPAPRIVRPSMPAPPDLEPETLPPSDIVPEVDAMFPEEAAAEELDDDNGSAESGPEAVAESSAPEPTEPPAPEPVETAEPSAAEPVAEAPANPLEPLPYLPSPQTGFAGDIRL